MRVRPGRVLILLLLCAAGGFLSVLALRIGVVKFLEYRYPLEYSDLIEQYSAQYQLPPSFLYAVAHTESAFDPEAVSDIGARGLMQITSDTFDWIQFRMGLESPLDYERDAFDPQVSVQYGAYLLKILYDEFGSFENALCAYHAGRGNVQKWLADSSYSSDGKTLDKIPFRDTQWYVSRVEETMKIYQKLYSIA